MHKSCFMSGAGQGCARLQGIRFSDLESVKLISRRSNKTSFAFITVTKCCCKSIKKYSSNSVFPWQFCLKKYRVVNSILCMRLWENIELLLLGSVLPYPTLFPQPIQISAHLLGKRCGFF